MYTYMWAVRTNIRPFVHMRPNKYNIKIYQTCWQWAIPTETPSMAASPLQKFQPPKKKHTVNMPKPLAETTVLYYGKYYGNLRNGILYGCPQETMAVGSPIDFPSNAMGGPPASTAWSEMPSRIWAVLHLLRNAPPKARHTALDSTTFFGMEQEASHHPNGVGWIKHWKNPSCLHSLFMFISFSPARVYLNTPKRRPIVVLNQQNWIRNHFQNAWLKRSSITYRNLQEDDFVQLGDGHEITSQFGLQMQHWSTATPPDLRIGKNVVLLWGLVPHRMDSRDQIH